MTAAKVALLAVEEFVAGYVRDYEMVEDETNAAYQPNHFERNLIVDAIAGLHAEQEFLRLFDAWRAACNPTPPLKLSGDFDATEVPDGYVTHTELTHAAHDAKGRKKP